MHIYIYIYIYVRKSFHLQDKSFYGLGSRCRLNKGGFNVYLTSLNSASVSRWSAYFHKDDDAIMLKWYITIKKIEKFMEKQSFIG